MTVRSFLVNLTVLLLAIFAPVNFVSAHLPVFGIGGNESLAGAQEIFEPQTAQMIFGRLGTGKTDFYKFKIAGPFNFHVQVLTPASQKYAEFRPTLAILGPGLAKTEDYLPFTVEGNLGAIVLADPHQASRTTFFDFETLSRYWKSGETRRYLVEPGTYWLAVFEPKRQAGAYALRLSDKEDWRVSAILSRAVGIFKLKFGLY